MARPGGKEVGRVSIRVIPDATKFRNDLKLLLKRVEQSMSANIMVDADVRPAEAQVRRLQKNINNQKAKLQVGADTLGAAAAIRYTARPRVVPLTVKIKKESLAAAATAIAALSGGRLLGDIATNIGSKLANLDKSLPRLAAIALAITSITSAAFASLGGLATVAAGLSSIAGIGLVLPGIFAGAALGALTLGIALSSAKEELAVLEPVWANLKSIITDNFWDRARKPIIGLVRGLLPQLRRGLTDTSKALGDWAASVAVSFREAFGGGVLEQQFAYLSESIRIASTGTGAFAQTIATLGTVGASYLPRLATWFAEIGTQFNGWLQAAAADGRMQEWIETAIVSLGQLGSIIGSTSSILYGLFTAAESAGGGGLATLAATLATVADIVNSAEFQSTLSTLFAGAAAGVSGLATALGPIGSMLTELAPTLATILSTSGAAVGELFGGIADALAQPAFAEGLGDFFAGIQEGLKAIGPSLPALAAALGSVGTFAGALAGELGSVLGEAFIALAPVLTDVLEALEPLLPVLGDALADAITELAPSLVNLIEAIAPSLPGIIDLIAAALPLVTSLLAVLTTPTGSEGGTDFLNGIIEAITWILNSSTGFFDFLQMVLSGAGIFELVAAAASGTLGPALKIAADIGTALGIAWIGMSNTVQGVMTTVIGAIARFLNSAIDRVNGLIGGINDLGAGISGLTGGAINISIGKLPHVPSLAMGATALATPGGTLVRVGEAGRSEDIVDHGRVNALLSVTAQLAARSLERGASGGDGTPRAAVIVNPSVGMSEETIGRVAADSLNFEFGGVG
jgi:hypothetical protein